jgi:hypothetical protein
MKATKIIYWVSTILYALFSMSGIFFMNNPQSTDMMKHLGVPNWLSVELTIGKFIGGLILILPFIPKRIKEWAYVAFGIDVISAIISLVAVDGPSPKSFSPVIFLIILIISYTTFHKLKDSSTS